MQVKLSWVSHPTLINKKQLRMKLIFSLLIAVFSMKNVCAQQKNMEYYVSHAIQNSPLLKDYQNQIQAGRIDSMRVAASKGIQIVAGGSALYAPVVRGFGYDNAITNGADVSALVTVSKEITGKGNWQNRFETIALQNQSALNSGKISEQDLKKNIASLYITAFGSWQQYKFNVELLDLLNKEEAILKQLSEKGNVKQTEYLSFVVNLRQQELMVENVKNLLQNNFAQLNYFCGIQDTTFTPLSDPKLRMAELPEFSNSIFYRQFEIDSLKLVNTDKQIDFSYKPKINLFTDGGYNSSFTSQPGKNFGMSVGVSLSIPLYDGGQRKMQHNQVKIGQLTRRNYLSFYAAQFNQQINQLLQQLQAKQRLTEQITKQIACSQMLMEANRKLLETGDIRIADYILSVGNYLSAKNMLVENTVEKYLIVNEINYWNRKN